VSAMLALGLLGGTAWQALLSASPVQIFEEGLQWRQDGRDRQRGWDEVREVYRKELYRLQNGARPGDWNRHSDLRLVFSDGEQVRFNHSLSDYNRLAEYIQQTTAECLLPSARKGLDGPGASFGPVQLTRDGLRMGRESYDWATLTRLRVANGYLCWNDNRGRDRVVALKDVANYPVMLRLLDELRLQPGLRQPPARQIARSPDRG
jgi:hypothetical protein